MKVAAAHFTELMDIKINLHPTIYKNTEFLCVEYPGVINDVNKMLATLGGPQHIAEVNWLTLLKFKYFVYFINLLSSCNRKIKPFLLTSILFFMC